MNTALVIDQIDEAFAKMYKDLGVSEKDFDSTQHGTELHRLVSLQISMHKIVKEQKNE